MDDADRPMVMRDFSRTISERSSSRLQNILAHMRTAQSEILPFSLDAIDGVIDIKDHTYLELKQNSRVYPLACAFISRNGKVQSLRFDPHLQDSDADQDGVLQVGEADLTTIGLGLFPFNWRGNELFALHQTVGQPVGTGNSVEIYTSLVLFAHSDEPGVLGQFCSELISMSERTSTGTVNVFEWHPLHQYWMMRSMIRARSIESVVLQRDTKDRLLADVREFLALDTKQWYREHGIPHKRGYLFHGVPGSGKTSLIQALAGHFEYNVCYIHLTHPHLTDDSLRAAVNQAPKRSLLVIEDIDAIFGRDREKLLKDSPLTFSGLLNSLDGVGKAEGQIFILTTNHRERLNPALIRNGRADVHVEFTNATDGQIAGMFTRFYQFSSPKLAQEFVARLREALQGRAVSTAALQHFFILHRRSSAAQALDHVKDVVTELEMRADEHELQVREAEKLRIAKEQKDAELKKQTPVPRPFSESRL